MNYLLLQQVTVDVVAESGSMWIKVIARHPKALDFNSVGANQFGQKTIVDQVHDLVEAAGQNAKMFRPPRVVFFFHQGISDILASKLRAKGVEVRGQILPCQSSILDFEESSDEDEEMENDYEHCLPQNQVQR